MAEQEETHWWFLAKRDFFAALVPDSSGSVSILDIGSGTGGFTSFLSGYGRVTVVEKSPYARPFLRKRGIRRIHPSLNRLKHGTFDMVCMIDSLYHRENRNEIYVINKVYSLLKPGGTIIIFDCAIPWLFGTHDRVMHARKRFTKKELVSLLVSAQFMIIRSTYLYFLTFPLFLIQRIIMRYINMDPLWSPPGGINALLRFISSIETVLIRYVSFPIGSSVAVIAKKPL